MALANPPTDALSLDAFMANHATRPEPAPAPKRTKAPKPDGHRGSAPSSQVAAREPVEPYEAWAARYKAAQAEAEAATPPKRKRTPKPVTVSDTPAPKRAAPRRARAVPPVGPCVACGADMELTPEDLADPAHAYCADCGDAREVVSAQAPPLRATPPWIATMDAYSAYRQADHLLTKAATSWALANGHNPMVGAPEPPVPHLITLRAELVAARQAWIAALRAEEAAAEEAEIARIEAGGAPKKEPKARTVHHQPKRRPAPRRL